MFSPPDFIRLKKWDNCYTFMLKFFNLFDRCCDIESDVFVSECEGIDYSLDVPFNDYDVLAFHSDTILENQRVLLSGDRIEIGRTVGRIHFVIVLPRNRLLDVTFLDRDNYIRIRNLSEVDCRSYGHRITVIRPIETYQLDKR
jgi:hypothetical protein